MTRHAEHLRPGLPVVPIRMRNLPVDERGYPVPWFVQWLDAPGGKPTDYGVGVPDFRVVDARKYAIAVKQRRCWICGGILGKFMAFVIGPMCAINRISGEPPSHSDCAHFAAIACPFLTMPQMRRRENDKPEGVLKSELLLLRNPGCTLVWVTHGYSVIRDDSRDHGVLFEMADPAETPRWYCAGRRATTEEVIASVDSGLPTLQEAIEAEPTDAARIAARAHLEKRYREVIEMIRGTAA